MLKKMERQFEVLFLSKSDISSDLYFRMITLDGSNQKERVKRRLRLLR